MRIEIKCIISEDGEVLQEFVVVEFETVEVIQSAGGVDEACQN